MYLRFLEFGRLTPEKKIRSTVEPDPTAPVRFRAGRHTQHSGEPTAPRSRCEDQCSITDRALGRRRQALIEDANRRTAIALLRKRLRDSGIGPGNWPTDRVKRVHGESHEGRRKLPAVHLDTLYGENELYCVWLRFFTGVLPEEYLWELLVGPIATVRQSPVQFFILLDISGHVFLAAPIRSPLFGNSWR